MKLKRTFSIDEDVHQALAQKARTNRRSTSAVVNEILKDYLSDEGGMVGLPLLLEPVKTALEKEMRKLAERIAGLQVRIALETGTTRRVALHCLMLLLGDKKAAMQFNEQYYTGSVKGLRKRLDDLPELIEAFTAETTTVMGVARSVSPTAEPISQATEDGERDGPISA
jgi:plasmid stability protein